MKKIHSIRTLCACAASLGMLASAHAATITFSTAMDTTSAADISTSGSLVKAYNAGGAETTVNGVTFAVSGSTGDDIHDSLTAALSPPGTYNAFDNFNDLGELDVLLSTGYYIGTSNGSYTLTLQDLTVGTDYVIQLFFMDQRNSFTPPVGCVGCNDRQVTYTSDGNSVTLEADPDNAAGAPYGQYALGYFTADATTQSFIISGAVVQQVNGWQLRTSTVPLPAAAWLLGSGLLGLVGVGRQNARLTSARNRTNSRTGRYAPGSRENLLLPLSPAQRMRPTNCVRISRTFFSAEQGEASGKPRSGCGPASATQFERPGGASVSAS